VKRLLVLAAVVLALGPVRLSAAVAPGIQGFAVTATVDRFPCIVPYCSGTLTGLGTATLSGTSVSSQPFTATWPDPTQPLPTTNTTGSLGAMSDFCPVGGPTLSPSGSGGGSFTLSGGLLNVAGQLSSGATLSGSYSFLREGISGLAISVSGATVTNGSGLVIAYQANLVVGVGGGAWTVMSGVATCGAPLSNPTVRITASYVAPE
jgi:hypothetical protein